MKTLRQQSGAALLIMLTLILLMASYGIFSHFNTANIGSNSKNIALQARLLRAKEALIARAVTDANRPGSLPCPDLITDDNGLSNHPNDGKSDNLTRNDCPSYMGWLPWVTLDLPETTDDSGTRLWYVLARSLRDDDLAQPINSDTPTTLILDGRTDIAALIIAPGAAVDAQNRPSNLPADYLDGENANGDNIFVSGPGSEHFNDVVLALSKQELMSAVEKRVAAEVRGCLEQHATASTNLWHDNPWPAPLSSSNQHGKAGSYFGQIPLTPPGAGPQTLRASSRKDLQESRNRLASATKAQEQMSALQTLNEQLAYAKTFYDRLYSTAKELALIAKSSKLNFTDLDSTLIAANSNGRISVTERKTIQTDSGLAQSQLSNLQSALADSGVDVFPDELNSRQLVLQNTISLISNSPSSLLLEQLKDASNALLSLFSHSHTTNSDISQSLENALLLSAQAVIAAQNAIASPSDAGLLSNALASASALNIADQQLQSTITGNRIALHPTEITARTAQLNSTVDSFERTPDTQGKEAVKLLLIETQSIITRINTQSTTVVPLRNDSMNTLNSAITASSTMNNSLFISSTREAIARAETLASAITHHADNLTRESLSAEISRFSNQLDTFNTIVTRTQAEMVPYAENLRLAAVNLQFWSEIINRQVGNIALQARKAPETSKTQSNPASAYSQADLALSGINKSTGTQSKLQDAIDNPNSTSKQNAAKTALTDTLGQVDKLLQSSNTLSQSLRSNEADAFPMLWYGSRCAFLQPGSDNTSWWLGNLWSNTTFYQISQRMRGTEGRLTVNGAGHYHTVALSAGQAIGSQNRPARRSEDYFEQGNADPSRNGDATSPSTQFTSKPGSAAFNDRLAY